MVLHIEALTFDTIIGLLEVERERAQRVIVDLKATYTYEDGQFVDYADIAFLIEEDLKTKRYKLLEEALIGIKNLLSLTYPKLKMLQLKISKPDILKGCTVAVSQQWMLEE